MTAFQVVLLTALCTCLSAASADPGAPKPPITPDPLPDVLPHACGTPVEVVPPMYPIKALRKAQTGWVLVELDVAEDGAVKRVEAVESSPPGVFEDSAVRAVRKYTFPASDSKRDDCRQLIEFNIGHWSD